MCHTKWEKDYSVTKYPHIFSLILVYVHSVWSLFSRVIQGLSQTRRGLIKQGEIRTGRGTFFYTDFCRTPLMDAPLSRFYIFWSRGFLVSLQVFLWHASCELGDPVVLIFYQSYHLDRYFFSGFSLILVSGTPVSNGRNWQGIEHELHLYGRRRILVKRWLNGTQMDWRAKFGGISLWSE